MKSETTGSPSLQLRGNATLKHQPALLSRYKDRHRLSTTSNSNNKRKPSLRGGTTILFAFVAPIILLAYRSSTLGSISAKLDPVIGTLETETDIPNPIISGLQTQTEIKSPITSGLPAQKEIKNQTGSSNQKTTEKNSQIRKGKAKTAEWTLESSCKKGNAWKDIFWRTSALKPALCEPTDDLAKQTLAKSRLGMEHLRESLQLRSPCGAYCVFHTDSLATRRRDPVTGWLLTRNGTKGCWKPVYDMESTNCFERFDSWTHWVELKKRGVPDPPCPECDAERAAAIERISKNVGRRCQGADAGSWKIDSFWRKSVEDPVVCRKPGVSKPQASLALGEDHLMESLATITGCGSHCIFHRHSLPRKAVPGSYGSNVAKKGWLLVDVDGRNDKGCFEPVEDIDNSDCKEWYNSWALWVNTSEADFAAVPASSPTECPKCDQLELPFGRYYWDEKQSKAVHVPPSDSSTICGPRILIVGAMKCGTNTVGSLLQNHPRVKINGCADYQSPLCTMDYFMGDSSITPTLSWEVHGMSHEYMADPVNWKGKYAQKLPHTDGFNGLGELTFDKSPSYFNTELFPGIVERAKKLLPNAKVVISVCNPVERLFSEFMHLWNDEFGGHDKLLAFYDDNGVPAPSNFTEFVKAMQPESDICMSNTKLCNKLKRLRLRTGEYHVHVKAWRNVFGAENVLVVDMDESSSVKARKLLKLAGGCLPEEEYPWSELNETSVSFKNKKYAGRSVGYSDHAEAMQWLHEYFKPHNQLLSEEVDADWPLLWNTISKSHS